MPKRAIVSFGADRPEMMESSFNAIKANPEHVNYDWFCYLDGQGKAQMSFYQEDWEDVRFVIRDHRVGLNVNILTAFRELFESYNYDYILYIEDDVLVSNDFIRFCEYAHKHYYTDDIFTITGFSRKGDADRFTHSDVCKFKWYHPWGVLIDKRDYALFADHIEPFLANPLSYMKQLGEQIRNIDRDYFLREFSGSATLQAYDANPAIRKILNITQDCLLNAVRAINHKYQLMPCWSRSQNMGFYGTHQPGEYNGEDCTAEDTIQRSMHATDKFNPPYTWDRLSLTDEVQL